MHLTQFADQISPPELAEKDGWEDKRLKFTFVLFDGIFSNRFELIQLEDYYKIPDFASGPNITAIFKNAKAKSQTFEDFQNMDIKNNRTCSVDLKVQL